MITMKGIDEALSNVPYVNKDTLKSRLLFTVRNYYGNGTDAYSVEKIDRDELIKTLWDLGNDSKAIKDKRRNFSSVKSSVNKDLKKLYENGGNPEGIILGPNNTFTMCSDAKDRILEHLSDTIQGSDGTSLEKITKVLEAVNEILTDPNTLLGAQDAGTQEKLDQLKNVLKSLSSSVGEPPGAPPPGDQSSSTGFDQEDTGELLLDPMEEVDEIEDIEEVDQLEELDETEDLEVVDQLEELDETEDLEVVDQLEELDETEDLEVVDQLEELDETEDLDPPIDSLGQSFVEGDSEFDNQIEKSRLLAEEFDGYLGTMDKFFNHFLIIPAGKYLIGSKTPLADDLPEKTVDFDSFYIGVFPVTNALFEIFVEKTGYKTTAEKQGYGTVYEGRYGKIRNPETGKITLRWQSALTVRKVKGACWYQPLGPGSTLHNKRSHPVVQVSLKDAIAFAAWTGKRLPSEEEWEAAARTSKGYIYPWGSNWKDDQCNLEESREGGTTPVDKYASHANELGIADTLGNVLEWTLDRNVSHPDHKNGIRSATAKGGSWVSSCKDTTLYSRYLLEPDFSSNILGFRCVAY